MRKTNIELLRGLLMFFVCGVHVVNLGALIFNNPLPYNTANFYWANLFDSFFLVGVDCFVLISGYFSINLNVKRLFKIIFPCFFYSILIGGIGALFFGLDFLQINHFPWYHKNYWFIDSYLLLCLLTPILNSTVIYFKKRWYILFLVAGFLLFSIVPTFTGKDTTFSRGLGVINLSLIYLIGRFLRTYYESKRSSTHYIVLYVICCLVVFAGTIVAANVWGYSKGYYNIFFWYNNAFIIVAASCLFLAFLNSNIRQNNTINTLAASFLNIYIIHCTTPIREYLRKFVDSPSFKESTLFPLYVIITAVVIFGVCLAIDRILNKMFLASLQTTLERWVTKAFHFIDVIIQKYKDVTDVVFEKTTKFLGINAQ